MYEIREATPDEYSQLGELMVQAYSQLEGFPGPEENPEYYDILRNVGEFAQKPKAKLIVAVSEEGQVDGGLVYFGDMRYYGVGGEANLRQKEGAFRLLAVNSNIQGKGLGKRLVQACIDQARSEGFEYLMIHSTKYMKIARKIRAPNIPQKRIL